MLLGVAAASFLVSRERMQSKIYLRAWKRSVLVTGGGSKGRKTRRNGGSDVLYAHLRGGVMKRAIQRTEKKEKEKGLICFGQQCLALCSGKIEHRESVSGDFFRPFWWAEISGTISLTITQRWVALGYASIANTVRDRNWCWFSLFSPMETGGWS